MDETWVPISGYETYYAVSNHGQVKRLKAYQGVKVGRLLKPQLGTNGYLYVLLSVHSKHKPKYLHSLLAEAFIGPRPAGMEINHIDGVKTNNTLTNLEYVTRSENKIHSIRLGLGYYFHGGEGHALRKLSANDVHAIRLSGERQRVLAERYGVTRQTISKIRLNQRWATVEQL